MVLPSPHHSEAVALTEWWNGFEDSVTVPAGQQYLVELGRGSPGGCTCSESLSNIRCCFSHSQDSGVQEPRGWSGDGSGPLTLSPHDPLTKVLLPVPTTLCPAGLEVLVPKGGILPPTGKQ